MAYLKPQSPLKQGENHIYPLTTADQVITDSGERINSVVYNLNSAVREAQIAVAKVDEALSGCWISFTDENGNPTDEPYIHWYE